MDLVFTWRRQNDPKPPFPPEPGYISSELAGIPVEPGALATKYALK